MGIIKLFSQIIIKMETILVSTNKYLQWSVNDPWTVYDIIGFTIGVYLGFYIELGSEYMLEFPSCEMQAVEWAWSLYNMSFSLSGDSWTDLIGLIAGVGGAAYGTYTAIDACVKTNK